MSSFKGNSVGLIYDKKTNTKYWAIYFDNSSLDILHQQTKYLPNKLVLDNFLLFIQKYLISYAAFKNKFC